MAKGKSQYYTLFCTVCNLGKYIIYRTEKNPYPEMVKKFCKKCRKHTEHKPKKTKKAS
jgi:ribosomal protein L33